MNSMAPGAVQSQPYLPLLWALAHNTMTMRKAGESAAMTQTTNDAVNIELTGGEKDESAEPQHETLEVWHSHLLQRLTCADDTSMKRYISRVTTMNFSFVLLCS